MMHPLRKEFIDHYKDFNKDKEFLKVNEVDQEDQEEIKELSKFLENEKEEIDVSDAQTIFFSFAEAGKKKDLLNAFEFASKQAAKKKQIGKVVNLFVPETVNINYSEYSKIPLFKNNIHAQHYKEGILLILNEAGSKKERLILNLSVAGLADKASLDGKIIIQSFKSCFRNFGQIDWNHKNFDDGIVFYVAVPQIIKNKALKICMKKNKNLNKLVKFFRESDSRQPPPKPFTHFYDKAAGLQNLLANLHKCQTRVSEKKGAEELKIKNNLTNKELLHDGYRSALIEGVNKLTVARIKNIDKSKNNKNYWLDIQSYENKSIDELKKEYLENVFPYEQHLEDHSMMNRDFTDKMWKTKMRKELLKIVILYYHTGEGKTLVDGTIINIDNKKQTDCILFWKKINVFELLFNVLNKHNFPLCVINSQIINDVEIYDPLLAKHIDMTVPTLDTKAVNNELGKLTFNFKDKHILKEAMESETGYLMPYDGVWEIPHDLTFSSLKFREYDNFITVLLFDHEERYFIEVFSKKEIDFKYMLWNHLKDDKNYSENCLQEIYTKIAVCIRDSKVLIERDSTMSYQGRRKPYGSNTDSIYEIWMPRRRYHRKYNKEQTRRDKDFFAESRVFSGSRRAHPRRLPAGSKPSKLQLLLAKNENMILNPGETYVKQSMWGDKTMPQRERRYRHRSLSGNFYFNNKEMSEAKKIDSMSGPQFEEYCEKYIVKQGWKIYKRNNYDGGIDIRALKEFKDGSIKTLLVQCKKWNKPIPPHELRAFKTATDEEEVQGEKILMFMAYGKYSTGARTEATKFNVELIEGDHFLK